MNYLHFAYHGFREYMGSGKLIFFFLLVLFLLWIRGRWEEQKTLLTYSSVIFLLCAFPPTAVFFMLYQTAFYDYRMILCLVPVTAVTAYGAAVLLENLWDSRRIKQSQKIGVLILLILLAVAGSRFGVSGVTVQDRQQEKKELEEVLTQIDENAMIWGTSTVMENARVLRPDIQLLYGRDLWQTDLNGLSYEEYPKEAVECYEWMEKAQDVELLMQNLLPEFDRSSWLIRQGVDYAILPGNLPEETVETLCHDLAASVVNSGNTESYILLELGRPVG